MTEMGKAMMGTGEASGEGRALMAAHNAIQNPLLDEITLKGAKAVLVNVTGGPDMTLLEVDEVPAMPSPPRWIPRPNTIFGAAYDDSLTGKIRVSVVATGMDGAAISAIETRPAYAPRVAAIDAMRQDVQPAAMAAPRARAGRGRGVRGTAARADPGRGQGGGRTDPEDHRPGGGRVRIR